MSPEPGFRSHFLQEVMCYPLQGKNKWKRGFLGRKNWMSMGPNVRVPDGVHEKLFPRLMSEEGGEEVNPVGQGDEGPLTLQSLTMLGHGVDWEEESPVGQDPGSLLSGRKGGNVLGSVPARKDPGTHVPAP